MNGRDNQGFNAGVEIVVFSGFNQRAVVAFLRTLEQIRLPYSIIASSPYDTIFQTVYRRAVRYTRRSVPIRREDLLAGVRKVKIESGCKRMFVAPTSEALNRFLLKHRFIFEREGCIIPLPDELLYETVSDKYSFGQLCRSRGIGVPGEYDRPHEFTYPCVAKPRRYLPTGSTEPVSPVVLHTAAEFEKFRERHICDHFYFQEYVYGRSLYLLYYFGRGGRVVKHSQENLMQQPNGKSIIAAVSSGLHESGISGKFERLLHEVGFRGLIMIEVRGDAGEYYMIEANPRFWGPSQLFVDARVNLFEYLLSDYGFIVQPDQTPRSDTKYYWHGGLMAVLDSGGKVSYHGYGERLYQAERKKWLAWDVYDRPDTAGLYTYELKQEYADYKSVAAAI